MTLKYLGVKGEDLHPSISGGIAFSTPCELESCVGTLEKRSNRIYRNRFFQSLRRKIEIKGDELPAGVDLERLEHIRTWREFDEYFSAPLNGYGSAREFYENSSANRFLKGTAVPTLVVNAGNDPILSRDCTPFRIADRHPLVFVEKPRSGGHVGFSLPADSHAWSEYRALEFAESCL